MGISLPDTTIIIESADQDPDNRSQRILFIGQKTASGSAVSGSLVQNIANGGAENSLFGANSMLAAMIRAAKKYNKICQFDAIPLSDAGGGVAAAGEVAFSGTATESGTLLVSIGSSVNHKYSVDIASGDTASSIGDLLEELVNADEYCPVEASNDLGDVALVAYNKGTYGNSIGIKVEGEVAGITVALTAMASGATNPTVTNIFNVVGSTRYQTIVWPYNYGMSTLTDFLDTRFNSENNILDGVGISSFTDTTSNLISALTALNSKCAAVQANKLISGSAFKGSALFELDTVIASQFAAVRALRFTLNAEISQYVVGSNGDRDNLGGPALASKPLFNTPFRYLPLIGVENQFTDEEVAQINAAGGFVLGNNSANNRIIAGQVVTTYKTNEQGEPDTTFKNLEQVDTYSVSREYMFNNIKVTYGQTRLTDGDLVQNRAMVNGPAFAAFLDGLYNELSEEEYVLTRAGTVAMDYFKKNRTIELDMEEGSILVDMEVPFVNQLRAVRMIIKPVLSNIN